jgi:hypothetical protein
MALPAEQLPKAATAASTASTQLILTNTHHHQSFTDFNSWKSIPALSAAIPVLSAQHREAACRWSCSRSAQRQAHTPIQPPSHTFH